jgi:hypothetical protein
MPIYCTELESIIKQWCKIISIKKPTSDPASFVSYRSLIKYTKKDITEKILIFLENLAKKNIHSFTLKNNSEIIIVHPKSKL